MRIAQVSPLFESVPPHGYGGTERIVSYLTEELVRLGHEVTLYASGDSDTKARLVAPCPRALRTDPTCQDSLAHHILMLEQLFKEGASYDFIHFHTDYVHFPLIRRLKTPSVTTLHGRLDLPDIYSLYSEFDDIPLVSISDAQRRPLPWVNWAGTVYHGLPAHLYNFQSNPEPYLAFLGRCSPEKGLDKAIEIAEKAGLPLKVAAKIDQRDQDYYEAVIKPLFEKPHVEYVGEIGGSQKENFLGKAMAVLFPIDWPEPFGLVLIESFACGTPVIAFRQGSVPEIMRNGETGFIVNDVKKGVEAVKKISTLDRRRCRQIFEENFTDTRMTLDYLKIYERILHQKSGSESWDRCLAGGSYSP